MARKTTGNTITTRSKKAEVPVPPAAVQVAPEVPVPPAAVQVAPEVPVPPAAVQVAPEVRKQFAPEVRKNAKPANLVPVNLEEEIRCRAHELYLQRGGTAGDPNQDWLIAEREIRSRYGSQERHTA